ncbi:hypothetical protein BV25DRAFT_1917849 [Artomyces pyxidatus]|uniref:Uncharacterized protein n=1 Tax=Artomyces pyxidatus TaxID=48021 RepID=A0ACB8SWC7_9AGAM|nr:hypothetical protein BV25DRAFT_1917849 [Artomyces pyxidatus]
MALPQNAIKTITLEGVVKNNATHEFVPVVLHRMTAPLNLVPSCYDPRPDQSPPWVKTLLESVPERPPSRLPPPGTSQLHGHLARFRGDGRAGIVFELDNVQLDGATADPVSVPRLVVKIARPNRLASLAREAWFYDEMECLQGSAIARCYGWFEMQLSPGQTVPAWKAHPTEDPHWHDYVLEVDETYGTIHPDQLARSARRDVLSVLLLEQLGPTMPLGPLPESARTDITSLYEDISHLGISAAEDVRWHNILQAPQYEPCLPSLPSPFTNRVHSWRKINFELPVKTNLTPWQLSLSYKAHLRTMFEEAEDEGTEDPWP